MPITRRIWSTTSSWLVGARTVCRLVRCDDTAANVTEHRAREDTWQARRSARWELLTLEKIGAAAEEGAVAVLPVGATEQHGPHLATGPTRGRPNSARS